MADRVDAIDEILAALKTVWDADTPALRAAWETAYALAASGQPFELVYEALEKDKRPHPDETGLPWARVCVRHVDGGHAAIGNKRFARSGHIIVQVFVPDKDASAWTVAQRLAMVAEKAYETAHGAVVSYKNIAVKEHGREGSYFRTDCKSDFWWHEVR